MICLLSLEYWEGTFAYAHQMSFFEIGQALGLSEARARSHFHRAKRLVRATLEVQLQVVPVR